MLVVDNLSRPEELDRLLEEADRNQLEEAGYNQLEEAGYNLLEEAGCILLEEAGCSSPTEEHVLVASSSCGLRPFVGAAVGLCRLQHWVYDSGRTDNKRRSSRIRWKR